MARLISSSDLAIGLEHSELIKAYKGRFVTFPKNSGIFKVSNVTVGSYTPDDRPEISLRFNFKVSKVPDKTELLFGFNVYISEYLFQNIELDQVFTLIKNEIKANVTIVSSGATEILYAEKQAKVSVSYATSAKVQGRDRGSSGDRD